MAKASLPHLNFSDLKETLPRALRLVWTMSPGWTAFNVILVVILGILPIATLFLTKLIVDSVTAGLATPEPTTAFPQVLVYILIAAVVALILALARSLSELTSEAQSMIVTDGVSDILHAQSIAVDLEYYEDTSYYDTLHRAQQESAYRPTRIVNGLVLIGQNGISLLGVAVLILTFNWLIALILFAAAIPVAVVRYYYARARYRFEQDMTETDRLSCYYHGLLTDSDNAKEVRLFNLGALFRKRFLDLRSDLRKGRLDLAQYRTAANVFAQVIVDYCPVRVPCIHRLCKSHWCDHHRRPGHVLPGVPTRSRIYPGHPWFPCRLVRGQSLSYELLPVP